VLCASTHPAFVAKFVMPANAGIQVGFRFKFKNRLDSGVRRNDGKRLPETGLIDAR